MALHPNQSPFDLDDCICTFETEYAILVKLDTDEELWVPKYAVVEGSEVSKMGDEGTLTIFKGWAEQECIEP